MILRKRHNSNLILLVLECIIGHGLLIAAIVAGDNSINSLPFEQGVPAGRSLQSECGNAILKTANGDFSAETTVGRETPSGLGGCKGEPSDSGPGVWFAVEGNGQRIKASTCNENTEFKASLLVFTGEFSECKNDQLICVESSRNVDFECGATGSNKATAVEFQSDQTKVYYILVQPDVPGEQGAIWMNFRSITMPQNDDCKTALGPIPPVNLKIDGSTFFASLSPMPSYCGVNQMHPGVWFSFFGTGSDMTISACENSNARFAFSLYKGPSCDQLECELGASTYSVTTTSGDQSKCLFQNSDESLSVPDLYSISFSSIKEQRYYVYVAHDPAQGAGAPLTGDFRFFTDSIEQPPTFPPVPYPTGTPSSSPSLMPTPIGVTAWPTRAPTPIPVPTISTIIPFGPQTLSPIYDPINDSNPNSNSNSNESSTNKNARSMLVCLLVCIGGWIVLLNGLV